MPRGGRPDAASFSKGFIIMLFGIFVAIVAGFMYDAGIVVDEIVSTTTISVSDLMFFIFFIFALMGLLYMFLGD